MGDGTIVSRVFAYAPDQALVLRNAEYARKIVYGNGWSRIRYGLLYSLSNRTGTSNILGAKLLFGIGTYGSPVMGKSTQNFLGVSLCGTPVPNSTNTLTYTAGSSGNDYYTPTVGYPFRKYGSTYVLGTVLTSGAYFPVLANSALVASQNRRAVLIVDITRNRGGSGAGTISVYCTTTGQVAQDFRADNMFDAMDRTGTPTLLGTAMTVLANATAINVGEEFGPLDTLTLYWSRTANPLEVYALGANVIFASEEATSTGGAYASFGGYSAGTFTSTAPTYSDSYGTNFLNVSSDGTLLPDQGFSGSWAVGGTWANTAPYTALNTGTQIYNSGTAVALYGTHLGWPQELFSQYGGTVVPGLTVNAGTFWASYGSVYWVDGSSNPAAQSGLSGTSAGMPRDGFELYAVGTVLSGVTVNSGTYWSQNAYVY